MSASERRIAQLEQENHKLREQIAKVAGGADRLEMDSGVNKNLDGFVGLRWGAEVAQFTPAETREHALLLLACADAAESDAAVMRGLRAGGFEDEAGFAMLRLIREHRDQGPEQR